MVVEMRRMSGALLEQFVPALGCPCAPSLKPVPQPFPQECIPHNDCGRMGLQWEFCLPASHKVEPLWASHNLPFAAANLELMMW